MVSKVFRGKYPRRSSIPKNFVFLIFHRSQAIVRLLSETRARNRNFHQRRFYQATLAEIRRNSPKFVKITRKFANSCPVDRTENRRETRNKGETRAGEGYRKRRNARQRMSRDMALSEFPLFLDNNNQRSLRVRATCTATSSYLNTSRRRTVYRWHAFPPSLLLLPKKKEKKGKKGRDTRSTKRRTSTRDVATTRFGLALLS